MFEEHGYIVMNQNAIENGMMNSYYLSDILSWYMNAEIIQVATWSKIGENRSDWMITWPLVSILWASDNILSKFTLFVQSLLQYSFLVINVLPGIAYIK